VKSGIDKQTKLNQEAVRVMKRQLASEIDLQFDAFWEKVKKDTNTVDAEKLRKALEIVTEPEDKKCFANATAVGKKAYRDCFGNLLGPIQSTLSGKE
jgi:hypothetical protein